MTEDDIDRITEIYDRTGKRKTIPEHKRIAVTAHCSGFTEEQVREALGLERAEVVA